jgi:hypothetical protein
MLGSWIWLGSKKAKPQTRNHATMYHVYQIQVPPNRKALGAFEFPDQDLI